MEYAFLTSEQITILLAVFFLVWFFMEMPTIRTWRKGKKKLRVKRRIVKKTKPKDS